MMLKDKCTLAISVALEKLGIIEKTNLADLDCHHTIVVEPGGLDKYKTIFNETKEIEFRVPKKIEQPTILRLKGLGKIKGKLTGNLLIEIWLNKGEDVNACLWLSESSAWNGTVKNLWTSKGMINVLVPRRSDDGIIIRMKGFGNPPAFGPGVAFHSEKRGDLLVRVRTYPDHVNPLYRSFGLLNTDAMALEGWVYQKIDEIISKFGKSILYLEPITADTIAEVFNEKGWKGIFNYLRNHLNLKDLKIEVIPTDSMTKPGECQQNVSQYSSGSVYINSCKIYINQAYIEDPICVAAILAHELCHVIYGQHFLQIDKNNQSNNDKQTLEQERMVDLLVFMHRIGGFQIRVSRAKHITLGYFDQETFDRMFVIVLKEIKKRRRNNRT
jgi:hypothetical protein